jgi:hypothetical protein
MILIWSLFLLSAVRAACDDEDCYEYLSSDDSDEAEMIGEVGCYFIWAMIMILLIFCAITKNRGNASIFIWNIVSYIQFIRWLPIIDFDIPTYYMKFIREFCLVFDYKEMFDEDEGETPDETRLDAVRIESSLFLANAEEQLCLWLLGAVLILLISADCSGKVPKSMRYGVVFRIFFVTFLDMTLFALL